MKSMLTCTTLEALIYGRPSEILYDYKNDVYHMCGTRSSEPHRLRSLIPQTPVEQLQFVSYCYWGYSIGTVLRTYILDEADNKSKK